MRRKTYIEPAIEVVSIGRLSLLSGSGDAMPIKRDRDNELDSYNDIL